MPDPGGGSADAAVSGVALAMLSAGTFGTSGIFASVLLSAGWSPAAVAIARLGGAAVLLTVPAVVQLRGRWALLRREAGRGVLYGLAIACGQLSYFNAIESIPIGLAVGEVAVVLGASSCRSPGRVASPGCRRCPQVAGCRRMSRRGARR